MNALGFPGYVFRGKTYKTINGLISALVKHHAPQSATGCSMVVNNTIKVYGARCASGAVATYFVSLPCAGEKQYLTECLPVDSARADAMVASIANIKTQALVLKGELPHSTKAMMPADARKLDRAKRASLLDEYRAYAFHTKDMLLHTPVEITQAIALETALTDTKEQA